MRNILRPVGLFVLLEDCMGCVLASSSWRGPCPPLDRLGEKGYMETLDRYEPRSLSRVLLRWFSSISTSSKSIRLVT